jgi:hypothetical protein
MFGVIILAFVSIGFQLQEFFGRDNSRIDPFSNKFKRLKNVRRFS